DLPPGRLDPGQALGGRRGAAPARLPARGRAGPRGGRRPSRDVRGVRPQAASEESVKRILTAGAAVAAVALATTSACRARGRPDPSIRMAISHERAEESAATGETGSAIPTRLQVPPAVAEAYSGIRLRWIDASTGKEGVIEV